MKKICFVTTIYGTYFSFLHNYSNDLHDNGWDVSLICCPEEGIEEKLPSFVHFHPVEMKRGVDFSALKVVRQMKKIFREQQFDIIQYSTPNASLYASMASKRLPAVSLYCQWGIRYMGFSGWKRALFKMFEKITCRNSDFVEAESHNIRSFSLSERLYGEDKSCVIWNGSASGVDLTKFDASKKEEWRREIRNRYNLSEDDTVFAFAARLTKDKGLNELLEAFLSLEKQHDSIKMLVMGGRDDTDPIDRDLLAQAQASSKITFTGNVPDVERYYAASDVFVAPSYREGFGLVVIEAEAMGLPAIVSDVPGQVDAIVEGKTGISCKVRDAEALRSAMEQMLENREWRIALGEGAVQYVRECYEQQELFARLTAHREELMTRGK